MNRHPNKHIQAAIEYAESKGWTIRPGGHYGVLTCPAGERFACRYSVAGTPRVPENEAKRIRRKVDKCPHCG